jgi:hypothetical protein
MKRQAAVAATPSSPQIEMWALDRIKPYPKNARKRSPQAVEKLAASIREFGFVQPIVVDKDGVIIIGHGRLDAAHYLKLAEAPVVIATKLTPAQVKALRLADNRVHEESEWDKDLLGPELLDLKLLGVNLDLTAFEMDEIVSGVFGEGKKKKKQAGNSADALEFKVVIDCVDEQHQAMLLAKFKDDGMKCRALIS